MGRSWLANNAIAVAGTVVVMCGLVFLSLTGAPPRLLLINLIALVAGIALVGIARLVPHPTARPLLLLAAAAALLATALLGASAEGASRWVVVGGLSLQPSLVLLPAVLLAHVAKPDRWSSLSIALAAVAMALQPDRSLAATIAILALADAALRRTPTAWATAAVPLVALAVTILRPDNLPAVAHVDQILWTSFADQPVAATVIWLGTLIMFAPALLVWQRGEHALAAAFGALWGSVVVSALAGNYPTPLVGYGASAILGYLLATLALPAADRRSATVPSAEGKANSDRPTGLPMAVASR